MIPQARDLFNVLDDGPMGGQSNGKEQSSNGFGEIPLIGEGLIDDPSASMFPMPPKPEKKTEQSQ